MSRSIGKNGRIYPRSADNTHNAGSLPAPHLSRPTPAATFTARWPGSDVQRRFDTIDDALDGYDETILAGGNVVHWADWTQVATAADRARQAARAASDEDTAQDYRDVAAALSWVNGGGLPWIRARLGEPPVSVDEIYAAMDAARAAWKETGDPTWGCVEGGLAWSLRTMRGDALPVAPWISEILNTDTCR
jgi:hypothetical protein